MAGGQNAVMDPNDRTIDLRPSTAKDFDFAWGLYRDSMKPLAEELMEWKEERQKVVVEREVVSGRASIIVAGGREVAVKAPSKVKIFGGARTNVNGPVLTQAV